ncbi:MAG: hypothetical protein IPJ34_21990 [Myxococcales bacterium]|nr:hypothetical protein [Myxococcales bacterium]
MTSTRRAFLAGASMLGLAAFTRELDAAAAPPVRFKWPWPVKAPDPHALGDPCAALLAATLYPPLYVRAVDGMLEPKGALAGPKEIKNGLRVDLVPGLRPSDVLASLAAAKSRGARLALRDVPVPRVEGEQSVVFPGFLDPDALMRRLATPLAGIARIEPRRLLPTGGWDLSVKERESTTVLELTRRPTTPAVGVQPSGLPRITRFELEGVVDLARAAHVRALRERALVPRRWTVRAAPRRPADGPRRARLRRAPRRLRGARAPVTGRRPPHPRVAARRSVRSPRPPAARARGGGARRRP